MQALANKVEECWSQCLREFAVELVQISETLRQDAVTLVFVNVFLQQIGLPVPAVPTLLLAGSLMATPGELGKVLAAAVLASVIADWVWYWSGKLFGYPE